MKYNDALRTIYHDLNAGYSYGNDYVWNYYDNKPATFPFFDRALYKSNNYIVWRHYGSSANKYTMKELYWIITEIFETTPEQFLTKYIRNDYSTIKE